MLTIIDNILHLSMLQFKLIINLNKLLLRQFVVNECKVASIHNFTIVNEKLSSNSEFSTDNKIMYKSYYYKNSMLHTGTYVSKRLNQFISSNSNYDPK